MWFDVIGCYVLIDIVTLWKVGEVLRSHVRNHNGCFGVFWHILSEFIGTRTVTLKYFFLVWFPYLTDNSTFSKTFIR